MEHSREELENLEAVKQAKRYSGKWLRTMALGVVLLGIASLINAIDDWVDSRDAGRQEQVLNHRIETLNDQFTCRYRIAQPAQELQAEISLELSLGLAAFAAEDEEGLAFHTARINELGPLLDTALAERASGSEVCDNSRE